MLVSFFQLLTRKMGHSSVGRHSAVVLGFVSADISIHWESQFIYVNFERVGQLQRAGVVALLVNGRT